MTTGNVAGGHKANMNNPNTSEEAKENSKQQLSELESTGAVEDDNESHQKNEGNVVGGHKANLKNPNTSEESKEHSRQVLSEHGVEADA